MKIGILNAYDARNMGDQAIVASTMEWCRRAFPNCQVRVFSHHFQTNLAFFGDSSTKPVAWLPPDGTVFSRMILPLWDFARYAILGGGSSPAAAQFVDCDFFILCGGGYLYSSSAPVISRNLLFACWQGLAAAATGKPVVLFPQSVGPLSKRLDTMAVKFLCKKTDLLMARTPDCLSTLQQWGLGEKSILVPDIVLAMRQLCPSLYPHDKIDRSGLGIAPIDFSFVPGIGGTGIGDYLNKLENCAWNFFVRTGEGIRLYLQVGLSGRDDDMNAITPLLKRLEAREVPVELVDSKGDIGSYLSSLRKNRVFIGCRMHACIFSLTTFTPTIGLAYQPKFQGTFQLLNLEDWLKNINQWDEMWMNERIQTAIAGQDEWMRKITDQVSRCEKMVLEQLDRAAALCDLPSVSSAVQSQCHAEMTIVTPSYRQLDLLKLNILSVRDQTYGDLEQKITANATAENSTAAPRVLRIEQIVQDALSPEVEELAREFGASFYRNGVRMPDHSEQGSIDAPYQLFIHSETDGGMYDAINRGYAKSSGEILAWLNCDEQYLPGTLMKVWDYFSANPDIDVVFGDALLADENGKILSYRRTVLPNRLHTQLSHLNTLSCATFVRRSVIERGFVLDITYKAIADAKWIAKMIEAGIRMAVIKEPLAVFTITQANLGQSSLAFMEMLRWKNELNPVIRSLKNILIAFHRAKKLLAGAYGSRDVEARLYLKGDSNQMRSKTRVVHVPYSWPKSDSSEISVNQTLWDEGNSWKIFFLWGVVFPLFYTGAAQVLDRSMPGVTLTPFLSIVCLLFMAMFLPPSAIFSAACIFSISVFLSFVDFGNVLWHEKHTRVFVVLRLASFITAAVAAVLFSAFRSRAAFAQQVTSSILANIPIPVLVSDATGIVSFANQQTLQLLNMSSRDVIGNKWSSLVMADQEEGVATRAYIEYFAKSRTQGQHLILHLCTHPDRSVPARMLCLGNGNRRIMVTVLLQFSK